MEGLQSWGAPSSAACPSVCLYLSKYWPPLGRVALGRRRGRWEPLPAAAITSTVMSSAKSAPKTPISGRWPRPPRAPEIGDAIWINGPRFGLPPQRAPRDSLEANCWRVDMESCWPKMWAAGGHFGPLAAAAASRGHPLECIIESHAARPPLAWLLDCCRHENEFN